MSRKPTPSPKISISCYEWGWASILILSFCALVYFGVRTKIWGLLIGCLPAILIFGWWLYGRILLLICIVRMRRTGFRGVMVTSDSPNWRDYIQKNWMPRIGQQFYMLNWSDRRKWEKNLPVRVFRHFCGTHENYCPSIILFQGLRHPLVYRFFYAFRDYKHGDEEALRRLENHLFETISKHD